MFPDVYQLSIYTAGKWHLLYKDWESENPLGSKYHGRAKLKLDSEGLPASDMAFDLEEQNLLAVMDEEWIMKFYEITRAQLDKTDSLNSNLSD